LQKLTKLVTDNTSAFVKLRALQPAAEAKRKLYEQALAGLNQLSRRSTLEIESGRIIAPASAPSAPSSLRRIVIYVVVGVFATGAAGLIAFLTEYLRSGFSTSAMVERTLGSPVITMIPLVRRRLGTVSDDLLAKALVDHSRSPLSTSVETARIVLRFSDAGLVPKVILITSAVPGEGKSAEALLIATSSALSGRRTVLVDCDLRHGSTLKQFGGKNSGPAEVLNINGETDITAVGSQDQATGLFLIPAGSGSKSPADLLSSQAMQDLIPQLRLQYGYVVLDAPPLLPVADALPLAAVEWGRTSRTSVSEALKTLRFAGHSVAGIALNKVDYKRLVSYGYGFGADYTYGPRLRAIGKY
jgi:capsular exopolysaccharide synthesis family protein